MQTQSLASFEIQARSAQATDDLLFWLTDMVPLQVERTYYGSGTFVKID